MLSVILVNHEHQYCFSAFPATTNEYDVATKGQLALPVKNPCYQAEQSLLVSPFT